VCHDTCQLLACARAGVDVGLPQLGYQQVPAVEDVKRQIAVAAVVAVEEASLLVSVQRIVGGIEVEDDALVPVIIPRSRTDVAAANVTLYSDAIPAFWHGEEVPESRLIRLSYAPGRDGYLELAVPRGRHCPHQHEICNYFRHYYLEATISLPHQIFRSSRLSRSIALLAIISIANVCSTAPAAGPDRRSPSAVFATSGLFFWNSGLTL
jgi:hypothetical protein